MIIQCRKCNTKFRFDDTLIDGDGVWVRCSRCQNVFFQQKPSDDVSDTEPEIPTVRVSEARRISEDRISRAEERIQRTEETPDDSAEKQPVSAEEPTVDVEDESLIAGVDEALEVETLAGQTDAVESEMIDENDQPDVRPAGRRWGRIILKLFVLTVFALIVAGALYLYLFPEMRTQMLKSAPPWLRTIPFIDKLGWMETKGLQTAIEPVRIKDLRQRSVTNLLAGNLRVIEGVAANQASYPIARIKVRLVIADAYDVMLGEKIVYCGNLLTDEELGALSEAEIQRELSVPQGSDVSNQRIAPNGEVPFMIVFNQEQAGAIKTTVTSAGADRVP